MSRIVYVNGSYAPEEEAKVSIFDRAFLFGDGVYEVTAVLDGRLVDFEPHLARLDRSLSWVVQRAWKMARLEIKKIPSVNDIADDEEADEG